MAPPILLAMAKHPLVDQYDLSSLTSILSGAAPLDEQLALAAQSRLRKGADDGVTVGQGYGMTELSPVSHTTPDPGCEPPGAKSDVPEGLGRLRDPQHRVPADRPGHRRGRRARGERGELWIRGPQVMKGYLNNAEATTNTVDADGWLHTGDVAVVDDEGRYTVVDRVKELIKYKGYQVAPAELEAVLIGHPEIADAAVIGVPDKESGEELPKAFVVRAPGSELTEEAVMEYMVDQGRAAQEGPLRRVHRRGAEVRGREDPAQGPQEPCTDDARGRPAASGRPRTATGGTPATRL